MSFNSQNDHRGIMGFTTFIRHILVFFVIREAKDSRGSPINDTTSSTTSTNDDKHDEVKYAQNTLGSNY